MEELIKIETRYFGGEESQAVNARDLWTWLEVKSRFNDWIRNKIEQAQLVENRDFETLTKNLVSGGTSKEYELSLEAAKHIAMLEGNTKGKEIRQYFIDYEKKAKKALQTIAQSQLANYWLPSTQAAQIIQDTNKIGELLGAPKHLVQVEAVNKVQELTGLDYTKLLTVSKDCDNIQAEAVYLEPSEIGKRLGLIGDHRRTGRMINGFLLYIGWQTSTKGIWIPTEEAKTRKLCFNHFWKSENGTKSGYNWKWKWVAVQEKWMEEKVAGVRFP